MLRILISCMKLLSLGNKLLQFDAEIIGKFHVASNLLSLLLLSWHSSSLYFAAEHIDQTMQVQPDQKELDKKELDQEVLGQEMLDQVHIYK